MIRCRCRWMAFWLFLTILFFIYSCGSSSNKNIAPPLSDTDTFQLHESDTTSGIETVDSNLVPSKLVPHHIHLDKGVDFDLNIPEGYDVSIAFQNLHRLRFLAKSPDGKLFATDMHNRDDNKKGVVYIFDGWDKASHSFKNIKTYLQGVHNPNQVAFYDKYIYVAETDRLTRYVYTAGDITPSSAPEVIATFPAYGLSYKYGGWHLTRSLAFHNGKLYVSIGSSCNACIEKEDVRASVVEMNPDGTDQKFFARGLRNSVAIKWVNDKLWATSMGRDLIGPDKPEDVFQTVEKNGYYGWPFYYQFRRQVYEDEQFKDSLKEPWVKKPPLAFCGFRAHSAPLGFDYFKDFTDPSLKNSFLVALHGSTTVSRQRGNAIVKITGTDKYTVIVSGFLSGKTEQDRHGRPCDILMNDDHSFFITDDKNGVLYYVWKKGPL